MITSRTLETRCVKADRALLSLVAPGRSGEDGGVRRLGPHYRLPWQSMVAVVLNSTSNPVQDECTSASQRLEEELAGVLGWQRPMRKRTPMQGKPQRASCLLMGTKIQKFW
ncbi:hypothetical protein PAAG_00855 [Paracoccidioides lutzii Pb01]|uniref:Uncharacterized protein n=1 Tax=Paracoccidioides lutzii (strain ATCC MYA-826 / Pb01) TaxID=502779 RepID=C1GQR0_PARBA|nr:hypothetical protein PAAG_00855 [Paracoccidioides lutzii Pb01]EEH37934.2 hypothetical protein PAAG_00855 [Paracoccidioides lutzii Pb01]